MLSHFHIVSMLCSFFLNQSYPLFARGGFTWQCYEKYILININQILKGLNQSNKIGMLHKIRQKTLIFLRSSNPSPIVLPSFTTPLPPSYFTLVEIHKLLIGTWCIPSTTVPVAVRTFFVFVCVFFVETYPAAPKTI